MYTSLTYMTHVIYTYIIINIEELLKQSKKSKYWLCQRMNMTSRNINRIIRGETSSITFKYIEEMFSQFLLKFLFRNAYIIRCILLDIYLIINV